jgi:hypothetical protein
MKVFVFDEKNVRLVYPHGLVFGIATDLAVQDAAVRHVKEFIQIGTCGWCRRLMRLLIDVNLHVMIFHYLFLSNWALVEG